jgi:glutaredoxin 3
VSSVDIYTKMWCPYCTRAMRLLEAKGIAYQERAIDFSADGRREMIERAGGRTTVPQIFIGDHHVGGCDDLVELERSGALDALLAA